MGLIDKLDRFTRKNWLPRLNGDRAYIEHVNVVVDKVNEIIDEDFGDNASLSGDNTFVGDNTFAGSTTFDENIQYAAGAYGVTAHAGGGQSGATPLTGMFSSIAVCATNGDSCILPAAVAGNFMIVATSEVVAGTPQIYPAVGEQIDTMGVNVPLTVTSGTVVMFSCNADGNWVSTSFYDINHIYNAINTAKNDVKPYDVYVALITQTGTNAPVLTVLENSFVGGTISASYNNVGTFSIADSLNRFTENKTAVILGPADHTVDAYLLAGWKDVNDIIIKSKNASTNANANDLLIRTYLEIRVYP